MKLEIPHFANKKDLFKFLVENKSTLIAQKKAAIKHADGIAFSNTFYTGKSFENKGQVVKQAKAMNVGIDPIFAKCCINTTNIIDSHLDMHVPKLWNRSLKNNGKDLLHLQEHEMKFAAIIADGPDLKAYTETMTWKELGFKYPGETECLVFESVIRKDRNPYMHDQYAMGRVKNHSVGMRYIQLVMCINDKDYGAEFEAWDKYLPMAVNPEIADDYGYFWAVTEAACIEGSAVPKGSNVCTPTMEMEPAEDKSDPEPEKKGIDYGWLAAKLKTA